MKKLFWIVGIAALCSFTTSCKSVYEKQGDKHLKEGRPLKALQRYNYVVKKGKGSKNFEKNLTKAYIGAMQITADQDPDIEKLLTFREKINELMAKNQDKEIQQLFAKTAVSIAPGFIKSGDFPTEEVGFRMIKDAETLSDIPEDIRLQISSIQNSYIQKSISEAEDYHASCMNGKAEDGIIADYLMSKMMLFVDETPAIKDLWSKIRKANLSTYLIYDLEHLIDNPIPQINRFGVLLAIRSMSRSGNTTTFQVQAYNGSTNTFKFLGQSFKLVDRDGKEYEPSGRAGAFSSKKEIERGAETNVGQVSFKVPKDTELAYLHFTSEAGESIKYLP
ncbi:hypothetical protein ACFL5V_06070 [Fibrobacterota bacterium]